MGDQKYSSYARLGLRRWRQPARGLRLSPTRMSVRRLRAKFWTLLGILGRYVRNVRLLTRGLNVSGCSSSPPGAAAGSSRRFLVGVGKGEQKAGGNGNGGSGKAPRRPPCMRSNSFYARAVAECLEFIKGSNAAPPTASLLAHGTPRRSTRC